MPEGGEKLWFWLVLLVAKWPLQVGAGWSGRGVCGSPKPSVLGNNIVLSPPWVLGNNYSPNYLWFQPFREFWFAGTLYKSSVRWPLPKRRLKVRGSWLFSPSCSREQHTRGRGEGDMGPRQTCSEIVARCFRPIPVEHISCKNQRNISRSCSVIFASYKHEKANRLCAFRNVKQPRIRPCGAGAGCCWAACHGTRPVRKATSAPREQSSCLHEAPRDWPLRQDCPSRVSVSGTSSSMSAELPKHQCSMPTPVRMSKTLCKL